METYWISHYDMTSVDSCEWRSLTALQFQMIIIQHETDAFHYHLTVFRKKVKMILMRSEKIIIIYSTYSLLLVTGHIWRFHKNTFKGNYHESWCNVAWHTRRRVANSTSLDYEIRESETILEHRSRSMKCFA